jgi:hypothetical protein
MGWTDVVWGERKEPEGEREKSKGTVCEREHVCALARYLRLSLLFVCAYAVCVCTTGMENSTHGLSPHMSIKSLASTHARAEEGENVALNQSTDRGVFLSLVRHCDHE